MDRRQQQPRARGRVTISELDWVVGAMVPEPPRLPARVFPSALANGEENPAGSRSSIKNHHSFHPDAPTFAPLLTCCHHYVPPSLAKNAPLLEIHAGEPIFALGYSSPARDYWALSPAAPPLTGWTANYPWARMMYGSLEAVVGCAYALQARFAAVVISDPAYVASPEEMLTLARVVDPSAYLLVRRNAFFSYDEWIRLRSHWARGAWSLDNRHCLGDGTMMLVGQRQQGKIQRRGPGRRRVA